MFQKGFSEESQEQRSRGAAGSAIGEWGWELGRTQASRASGVVGFVLRALGSQRCVRIVFLSDESGTSLESSG